MYSSIFRSLWKQLCKMWILDPTWESSLRMTRDEQYKIKCYTKQFDTYCLLTNIVLPYYNLAVCWVPGIQKNVCHTHVCKISDLQVWWENRVGETNKWPIKYKHCDSPVIYDQNILCEEEQLVLWKKVCNFICLKVLLEYSRQKGQHV